MRVGAAQRILGRVPETGRLAAEAPGLRVQPVAGLVRPSRLDTTRRSKSRQPGTTGGHTHLTQAA